MFRIINKSHIKSNIKLTHNLHQRTVRKLYVMSLILKRLTTCTFRNIRCY